MKQIKKYTGFILNAIKEQYAYKLRALVWMVYDLIMLFVQYFLWKAIFEANGGKLYDISMKQYINYIVVGLVTSRFLACFIDGVIADEVKSGNIAMNLIKPYSYIAMNFAKQLGYTAGGLIVLTPLLVVSFLLTGFIPIGMVKLGAFIVSLGSAYLLIFLFNMLLGICAFWITNYWGLRLLKWHFFAIFSGELIAISMLFKIANNGIVNFPIPLPAGAIQGFFRVLGIIAYCLPFQSMAYTPTAIYTGMISGTAMIALHIGLQFFWIFCLAVLTKLLWKKAVRQMTILGG